MLNDSDLKSRLGNADLRVADLGQALKRLQEALLKPGDDFIRDAAIKRFEFCFELAWKSIQAVARLEGQDCATPRAAFSLAWQARWLEDEELWLDMLDAWNKTTHTYREATAKEVFSSIPRFLPALGSLLRMLQLRLQGMVRP
jgi:nucleotidyltransferase substrate binding protein (TIGR01987 family)